MIPCSGSSKKGRLRQEVRENLNSVHVTLQDAIPRMELAVTHPHTVLQPTEATWPILSRSTLKRVMVYKNIGTSNFIVDTTF